MDLTQAVSTLYSFFPDIDSEMVHYIEGILRSSENEFQVPHDIYKEIGDLLHDLAGYRKDEKEIETICCHLWKSIKRNSLQDENGENKVLSSPVHLRSVTHEYENDAILKTIWKPYCEVTNNIDQQKLEKAETKLKLKKEKREKNKSNSRVKAVNKEATAVQAANRKVAKMEAKGKNKCLDIKIENFDVAFGDKILLKDADLSLVYGRRYGMVGRNGVGKSTLLKMISSGQLKISSYFSVLHVEQEVVGDDTTALDSVLESDEERQNLLQQEKKLTKNLESCSSQDGHKLNSQLQNVYMELEQIEADKAPAKASVILAGLGFSPEMQKSATKTFSGGWRMRIALARALFSKPDLLLLDEPSNMLDIKAIIWLENYLQTWDSTLLLVSHDRCFLNLVATDILHLHSQRIESYRGNYDTFVKTITDKLRHQQKEYEAQQQYRAHIQVYIDKFRAHASQAALVQSKIKMLEKMPKLKPVEKEQPVVFRFAKPEYLHPPVLQLDEVSFAYNKSHLVLKKISLSANMESRICIVGENGSGKTTLLKLLIGELDPIKGIRHSHRNLVIGYFTQHHVDQLDMNISALEFLAKKFPGKPSEEYRRQLGCFGVSGDLALQSVATLSGGQKSRVAFTAIAMSNPSFLVLDEPTNHLDVETVHALGTALQNFTGGVILVSHDQTLIEMVCKELWVCKNGQVSSLSGGFSQYKKVVEAELNIEV